MQTRAAQPGQVRLERYNNAWFRRGRPRVVEALWIVVQACFVSSWIPGAAHRRFLLRLFGAKIGRGGDMKPGVRVKFPWRLSIGSDSWIGESVWIDNLADVIIGSNVCISQGAYICTGSHDWSSPAFSLIVKPVKIGDEAWVAAQAMVGPGVSVGNGSVLCFGSAALQDLDAWTIYRGAPAIAVRKRTIFEAAEMDTPPIRGLPNSQFRGS